MKIWRDKYVIGMIAMTLLWGLFIWLEMQDQREAPNIERGVLDLNGWDWEGNGIFPLDGEWMFYPDALLTREETQELKPTESFITVPGNWDGWKKTDGSEMKGQGYGTYRLIIQNAPKDRTLAIAKQYVRFSDKIYVDGLLLGQSGTPGFSRDNYEPRNVPYTAFFRAAGDEIEVILQVANFDFLSGGVFNSIELGTGNEIATRNHFRSALELMGVGILILFMLLFLFLYFGFDRNPLLLLFGAFSICYALGIITNGERLFLQLFPDIPFELAFKVKYISVYMIPGLMFFIAMKLIENSWIKRWLFISVVIMSLYGAAIAIFPFRVYSLLQGPLYLYTIIINMLLVAVLGVHYVKRRFGQLNVQQFQLLLAGVWLQVLTCVVTLLNTANYIPLVLTNISGLLLLISIGLLLISQYIGTYDSMRRLTHQLQMADQMKDEFLLITSHELNTPLHGVINVSQSLLSVPLKKMNERELKDKLQLIRNTAYRMSNMVKDIIDASHIKDGRLEVRASTVDLATCVTVVMEVFGFLAKGKNVQLHQRIASDARYVSADENRLLQVMYNVIHHILRHRHDTIVWIESSTDRGNVRIDIELKNTLASHFSPHEAEEESREGFARSMSIARELIERMGGAFSVNESSGAVTFWLASERRAHSSPLDVSIVDTYDEVATNSEYYEIEKNIYSSTGIENSLGTIVVASADPIDVEHLYSMLTLEGFSVHCVGTDEEAYNRITGAKRPDLIIVDVMLPEGNGYELCRKLRRHFNHAELPILLISARSTPADIEAGIVSGASDFITRPFDAGEVRVRIHTLFAMNRLVKEAALNEMAFLRSQIKPHFLYNALGTIMSLCYTNGERAGELLGSLSRYLRIIFHLDNTEETVPLGKEMELIQAYVDIERERFGTRLRVELDVDEQLYNYRVMPLTIEPLVENAIRHGVSKKVEGGTVRLTIARHLDLIEVVVEDDGIGMTVQQVEAIFAPGTPDQGVGFRNIMRRLLHLTGKPPSIESVPGEGTKVTIWLPPLQ
ncbi:ATP-binding protein [Paenibacillus sp. L3-i20]|uniref:hybrid sensor histidine kinase/response regulator n=1 Tax=Paenibacillus sp. L3-i20 TaxID=2905833 RepID=UPI001EE13BF4|nr:histidine kinase [Paenibacillus sp. L3-i20]